MEQGSENTSPEGEKAVVRSTWSGTHKGELVDIPPSGKSVSFGVYDAMRIAGGKVVEHWGQMDNMGLVRQLGIVPASGEGQGGNPLNDASGFRAPALGDAYPSYEIGLFPQLLFEKS